MIKRGPHIITDQLTFYVDAANSKSYTSGSSETLNIINPSINPGSLDNGLNFTTSSILFKNSGLKIEDNALLMESFRVS